MSLNYCTVICMDCGKESSDRQRLYQCPHCRGTVELVHESASLPEPASFSYAENQQMVALIDAQLAQLLHYCKALQDAGDLQALAPQQHQAAVLMQIGSKLKREGERLAAIEKDQLACEQARQYARKAFEASQACTAA